MPGFSHGGNMHTILSWGMGVESTAILVRWLLDLRRDRALLMSCWF